MTFSAWKSIQRWADSLGLTVVVTYRVLDGNGREVTTASSQSDLESALSIRTNALRDGERMATTSRT